MSKKLTKREKVLKKAVKDWINFQRKYLIFELLDLYYRAGEDDKDKIIKDFLKCIESYKKYRLIENE